MKRLFAISIAIVLSWGLVFPNPIRANADAADPFEMINQCLPETITHKNKTVWHLYVKNSLIYKAMSLRVFVDKAGKLSGLESDPKWYRKLRVGQKICIPSILLPTYVELRDPTGDPSNALLKWEPQDRLNIAINKDHLYKFNPEVVRAYYEKRVGKGIQWLYRTNSLYQRLMSEKEFCEVLEKFNKLTTAQLINLKSSETIKIPAVPPLIYTEGDPVNSLVVHANKRGTYRLEPTFVVPPHA